MRNLDSAFKFSTKARNLAQLRGRLHHGRLPDQEVVLVSEWRAARSSCLARICDRFSHHNLIVRSSAPGEDSRESSMAGAFESIANVAAEEPRAVASAIDEVVASYAARRNGHDIGDYEVLIQPMVGEVRASGVVFTRDLEKNGPYYVVNYDDETQRTDSVTAGIGMAHKVVRLFRGVKPAGLSTFLAAILNGARELESVTGSDAIDIEFAIDGAGRFFVLQVRPLVHTRILSLGRLDAVISAELDHARNFIRERFVSRPGLYGRTTILGEMPDWNPAEIIGTHPKPLASSLYSYIIMRSVWREARHLLGYRHPSPYQLLVEVAGRPYVDVRCSFNSFLPATLRPELGEKLINFYLDELQAHPEFHDKVEFEIVITCLVFDFERQGARLARAGFPASEVAEIREALRQLTDNIVSDPQRVLDHIEGDVQQLKPRREAVLDHRCRPAGIPLVVEHLLDDCIQFGTLPFSVFARCAFIGTSFLRSLLQLGVLTRDEYDAYLHSIDTVAGEFVNDLDDCKAGSMSREAFLGRYGHLRPGTYDICAPTYAEKPDLYLSLAAVEGRPAKRVMEPATTRKDAAFSPAVAQAIEKLISEYGFSFSAEDLNRFIIRSVRLREAVKFEFTKNLSAALSLLVEFGGYHGLNRESLSFVPIDHLLALANHSPSADWSSVTRELIDRNRSRYELVPAIHLPDLIFSERDIEVVTAQRRRPNFVTQKRVVARVCHLDTARMTSTMPDLAGIIVLIENADPGYDWLFGEGIGGLVTKYGGAASHMTIRCAEFGLPAAVGCGEQIFDGLSRAESALLDCAEGRIEPYAL